MAGTVSLEPGATHLADQAAAGCQAPLIRRLPGAPKWEKSPRHPLGQPKSSLYDRSLMGHWTSLGPDGNEQAASALAPGLPKRSHAATS